uniref:Uncharacterized protein n=1 Tax=Oryza meridionalis TaxID=40149 RepID=A0A0E0F8K9_9ORYZ
MNPTSYPPTTRRPGSTKWSGSSRNATAGSTAARCTPRAPAGGPLRRVSAAVRGQLPPRVAAGVLVHGYLYWLFTYVPCLRALHVERPVVAVAVVVGAVLHQLAEPAGVSEELAGERVIVLLCSAGAGGSSSKILLATGGHKVFVYDVERNAVERVFRMQDMVDVHGPPPSRRSQPPRRHHAMSGERRKGQQWRRSAAALACRPLRLQPAAALLVRSPIPPATGPKKGREERKEKKMRRKKYV